MLAIDVHILTLPGDNADWLQQAIDSVTALPGATPHIVQGVAGHLGLSRAAGYAQGSARFVSFVDSDDYLLPGFEALALELNRQPEAAACYGQHLALQDGALLPQPALQRWTRARMARHPAQIKAPIVYRREAVMPYLDTLKNWARYPDRVISALAARHGRFVYCPLACYVWRQHDNNMHIVNDDLAERARARRYIWQAMQC